MKMVCDEATCSRRLLRAQSLINVQVKTQWNGEMWYYVLVYNGFWRKGDSAVIKY